MADSQQHTGRGSVTGGTAHQPFDRYEAKPAMGGHPHGKVTSWAVTGVAMAAFVVGGVALILQVWWLFWVCVGVAVAAFPAGLAVRITDDTVIWGATPIGSSAAPAQAQAAGHAAGARQPARRSPGEPPASQPHG